MENCPNCLKNLKPVPSIFESSVIQFYGCENCNIVWKYSLYALKGGEGKVERHSNYQDYFNIMMGKIEDQNKIPKKIQIKSVATVAVSFGIMHDFPKDQELKIVSTLQDAFLQIEGFKIKPVVKREEHRVSVIVKIPRVYIPFIGLIVGSLLDILGQGLSIMGGLDTEILED